MPWQNARTHAHTHTPFFFVHPCASPKYVRILRRPFLASLVLSMYTGGYDIHYSIQCPTMSRTEESFERRILPQQQPQRTTAESDVSQVCPDGVWAHFSTGCDVRGRLPHIRSRVGSGIYRFSYEPWTRQPRLALMRMRPMGLRI